MSLNRKDAGLIAEQISSVILLILAFWVLCYRLDAVPMYLWDESRQANNALEMLDSGNLCYTTYDGLPDFWNTKPHLLVIIQAFFMKMLGPGLLALRLPSALAGCITLLAGFCFLKKRSGFSVAAAWIAVMLGCGGFNTYHVVRTGDYDALLTMFIFLATLSWLRYIENPEERRYINYTSIWFTAALLTKGIAAAMWLPCWLAMGFFVKPGIIIKIGRVAWLALIPLFSVVVYYGLHEWQTPGYIHAVLDNEFSGRYLKPNEGHNTQWYYYVKVLWSQYFIGYVVLSVIAGFIIKLPENRRLYLRILAGTLFFLCIISASATRIYWYLAPVIPILALLLVLPLGEITSRVFQMCWKLVIAALLVWGYFENYHHNTTAVGVNSAAVLLKAEKTGKLPFRAKWHVGHYHPIEKYYKAVLKTKSIDLPLNIGYSYNPNDTVIVSSMDHLDTLNKKYYMRQHHYPTDALPVWVMVVDSSKFR